MTARLSIIGAFFYLLCLPNHLLAQNLTQRVEPSVVHISVSGLDSNGQPVVSTSSGFIISHRGHVLTTYHALRTPSQEEILQRVISIRVRVYRPEDDLTGGLQGLTPVLLAADPELGVVLLKLPEIERRYRPLKICASGLPARGDMLQAFGHPQGQLMAGRSGQFDGPDRDDGRWQTGINASPGMSGGPVTDEFGRVLGFIEFGRLTGGDNTGVTPINWAYEFLGIARAEMISCERVF